MFRVMVRTSRQARLPKLSPMARIVYAQGKPAGSAVVFHLPAPPEAVKTFGPDWAGPMVTVAQPNGNLLASAGELFWSWWGGGPPVPPVITAKAEPPPGGGGKGGKDGKLEIDTSGCRLLFLNAMRQIIQSHLENRQKADKDSAGQGDGTPAEPEGVALKKSLEGSAQAQAALEACLKKGKTTPDAVVEIIRDEAKSMITDLVKSKFASTDPLKSFIGATKSLDKDYGTKFISIYDTEMGKAKKIADEISVFGAEAMAAYKDQVAAVSKLETLFTGVTKEYKDLIKGSDGLTTLRPGVVKALEKARDTADEAQVDVAAAELKKQRDDLKKLGAKATTFLKEFDAFEKKYIG